MLYISPAEIAEIAEILGPSQMAGEIGRSKFQENLIQNISKYKGPSQMAEYICPAEIKEIAER